MLNANKSEIFCSGIHDDKLQLMRDVSGFKLGTLPVRHLGIPLDTKKPVEKDFDAVVLKMKAKVESWGNRKLSFAGRLQLVQAVLFSLQVFWCRHFLIHAGVIRKIKRICASFQGKENLKSVRGARVSWYNLSFPKAEGGFGLRNLKVWNRAYFFA